MPRKQKKYHYIYKTTCQVTGKFYIGMHSTDDLDDGYLGSGKILGYSIGKHGRENHKKEILEFCETRDDLKKREAEVVNEELLANPLCINLKYGGEGGWDHIGNRNLTSEKFQRYRDSGKLAENGRLARQSFTPEIKSRRARKAWQTSYEVMCEASLNGVQAMASTAANEKRKTTFRERGHQRGEKNSSFGTCWVTNGVKPVKIKKEQLDGYLANGYRRGRK